MNSLLFFFAFPIAIIIFSTVLQRLLNSPVTVAAIIFAIFIVLTFAVFDQNFLIATLAYTILAYITALLVCRINNHTNTFENTNNITGTITLNKNTEHTIPDDDNVLNNNCGCMYNRRCRKF